MLANKGQCFRDMVVHPYVDELVGHILGKDFILSTHSANIAKPGGIRMGLHTDQWWMPQPIKPGEDFIRASEISRKASTSFFCLLYTSDAADDMQCVDRIKSLPNI